MSGSWPQERNCRGLPLRVVVAGPPQPVARFIRSIAGFTVLRGVAGGGQEPSALRGRVGLPNGLVLELVGVSDELAASQQARRVIGQILVAGCEPSGQDRALVRALWSALPVPAVLALGSPWDVGGGDELAEHRVRAGLGLPGCTTMATYDVADRNSVRDVLLALLVAVLDLLEVSRAARREANG